MLAQSVKKPYLRLFLERTDEASSCSGYDFPPMYRKPSKENGIGNWTTTRGSSQLRSRPIKLTNKNGYILNQTAINKKSINVYKINVTQIIPVGVDGHRKIISLLDNNKQPYSHDVILTKKSL